MDNNDKSIGGTNVRNVASCVGRIVNIVESVERYTYTLYILYIRMHLFIYTCICIHRMFAAHPRFSCDRHFSSDFRDLPFQYLCDRNVHKQFCAAKRVQLNVSQKQHSRLLVVSLFSKVIGLAKGELSWGRHVNRVIIR